MLTLFVIGPFRVIKQLQTMVCSLEQLKKRDTECNALLSTTGVENYLPTKIAIGKTTPNMLNNFILQEAIPKESSNKLVEIFYHEMPTRLH